MVAAAMGAGAVTACGGPAPGTAKDSTGEPTGTIRLVTPIFEGNDGQALLTRLLAKFQKQHPGVEVEVDPTTYGKLNEKLATSIASGRPYDVMMMGAGWIPPFAAKGVLAELDRSSDALTRTYEPRVVEAGVHQGKVYALPVMLDARFGIYRKDIFAEVEATAPPKSFAELRALAKELTVREADGTLTRAGIDILSHDPRQLFETLLWAAGGDLFDEQLTAPAFHGPEGVTALSLMTDLVRKDRVIDIGFTRPGATSIPLLQGRAAMALGHNNLWIEAEKQAPELIEQDRLGTFVVTDARPALFQGGTLAAMSASSRHPAAANALVRFLASPEVSLAASRQRGNIPAAKSTADSSYVRDNAFVRFAMENLDVAFSEGGVPAWLEIRGEFAGAVESALLGKKTPKQALDDLAATATQAMSRRR
ncbi:MAG TPA: ABC transporter substrate-binding protein [Actinopolymorphaceae bacterium]